MRRTSSSASTSTSTSARELCTPNDAREVAGTPRRRISGCAQWCPARMHTLWRATISATSCGCTPSIANETAVPRWSPGVGGQVALVRDDVVDPERGEPLDRGAEPGGLGERRRAGLELPGQRVPARLLPVDRRDHVPAAEERRHLLEQLAPPVEHADP